jgi:3-oxoacyl-[acyl-carrier protein] reductase
MKKTAFITGAGGYIGGETARRLARDGYAIAASDLREDTLAKTVESIRAAGGEARAYAIDVTDSDVVDDVAARVVADFGSIDALVHVAGGSARIGGGRPLPLVEQDKHVIDTVLKVNLYGALWTARAAARTMIAQGRGGRIVAFASIVGLNGLAGCADYAAAKGGVMSLMRVLAKELGKYKITANAVAPGVVMRPGEGGDEAYAYGTNFLGEKCTAADVAGLVSYLCSPDARFVTGQTYVIDGGRSLAMKGSD